MTTRMTMKLTVERSHLGIFMTEIDLELTEVFAALKKMRGVRMAKRMHVGEFLNTARLERQPEAPLQSGAAHRFGGGGSALAAVTFSREQERGMAVSLPLLAEQFQGPLRQGHVAITVAFAFPDVEEHALGIDVAHLQPQSFT